MGPSDDATDGEHPPVYLPSMTSGDNRCIMNKALKGSAAEKPSKLPQRKTTQKRKAYASNRILQTRSGDALVFHRLYLCFSSITHIQLKVPYQANELIVLSVE